MTATYVVKGARLLGGTATDLVVADGVVAEIGPRLSRAGAEVGRASCRERVLLGV